MPECSHGGRVSILSFQTVADELAYHAGPMLRASDLRLVPITFGNFAIGSSAMIVIGLMNEIAADLGISISQAGMLAAATTLVTAVAATPLGYFASRHDRRLILSLALTATVVAQVSAALAPGFLALLVIRLMVGLGTAMYPATAATAASQMAPPAERGRAVSMVFIGYSAASVIGIPLGVWLGAAYGWRATMLAIGAVALVSLVWIRGAVPKNLRVEPMGAGTWKKPFSDARIVTVLSVQVLQGIAQMMSWVYIAPTLKESLGATPVTIGLLLSWFGIWAIVGQATSMRLIDRLGAQRMGAAALVCMFASLALLPLGRGSLAATALILVLWALGSFAMTSTQQVRLIGYNPALAPVTVGLSSAGFALGNMSGSLLGGAAIAVVGLSWLSTLSAVMMAVAIALHFHGVRLDRRHRRTP